MIGLKYTTTRHFKQFKDAFLIPRLNLVFLEISLYHLLSLDKAGLD